MTADATLHSRMLDRVRALRQQAPRAFSGWALAQASALDAAGARGLVADLTVASPLRRHGVFIVLGCTDLENPEPFLERLGGPDGQIGDLVRTRPVHDLVAATFGVEPDAVPRSFSRALMSIGPDPLNEPGLYRRLFAILTTERHSAKAHALRYCGPITDAKIHVVDLLDPVLLHPEIVKCIHNVEFAENANRVVRFLKEVCSTATDEALHAAARQAIGSSALERFARRWVERADRFPDPPFPAGDGLKPLMTAAEMIATGREFRNCLGTSSKIAEVLLGSAYHYRIEHSSHGSSVAVVVELTPLSNGQWLINEIVGIKGQALSRGMRAEVVRRMLDLGAVLAANPQAHPDARELESTLGIHRFGVGALDDAVVFDGC